MLLKFTTTLEPQSSILQSQEKVLERLVRGSLVQSLLSQPEHKASTPISFSPILRPLKCFLALVLPLLVASWCTDLLNFAYLAHPAFHWRSRPHSISDEKRKEKESRSGTISVYSVLSLGLFKLSKMRKRAKVTCSGL